MAKRTFTPIEWFHLTELAQAALLSGLLAARRWSAGELKFQGGTSLHLVYGSPRFSEDLDFVTATHKGLQAAMKAASTHVRAAFEREFPNLVVTLKVRDEEGVPDPRNPRLFTLSLAEPDWHQSLKVKVEFFIADDNVTERYDAGVRGLAPLRPKLRVDIPDVHIETAELAEILCDKLHALGDRDRLKERDVFDLWWICGHAGISAQQAAQQFGLRHRAHMDMYPNGLALPELAQSLRNRAASMIEDMAKPEVFAKTVEAIARWLPSEAGKPNILVSEQNTRSMIELAASCANETALVIDGLVQNESNRELELETQVDDEVEDGQPTRERQRA